MSLGVLPKKFPFVNSLRQRQTTAQKATRIRFSHASVRAKEMLANHDTRVHYEQESLRLKLPNAYTTALRDQLLAMDSVPRESPF